MASVLTTAQDRAAIAAFVQRRFRDAAGQARLEGELRQLAYDILDEPELDSFDPACTTAIERTTRAAVTASVEPLVARFIAELVRGLATLPAETRQRIISGGCSREFGFG